MTFGLTLHSASNPFSTRGGSSGCSAIVLPHVTPSPRVPAADVLLPDPPLKALLSGGSHSEGSGPRQAMWPSFCLTSLLPQEYLQ